MKVAHPANVLEAKVPDLSAPPGEEEVVNIMEEEMVIMGIIILTPTGYQE